MSDACGSVARLPFVQIPARSIFLAEVEAPKERDMTVAAFPERLDLDVEAMYRMRMEGSTLKEVAAHFDVAPNTVRDRLLEAYPDMPRRRCKKGSQ